MNATKRIFMLGLVFIITASFSCLAQTLEPSDLKTNNIKSAQLMKDLFIGNSLSIDIPKNKIDFLLYLESYMYAQSGNCGGDTEIYVSECLREMQEVDRFNNVQSSTCLESKMVPSGSFTTAELYNTYISVKGTLRKDVLSNALDIVNKMFGMDEKNNEFGGLALDIISNKNDMKKLFAMNPCNSRARKLFEKNLIRFANNQPLLGLDGKVRILRVDYSQEQDYEKLMEDFLKEDAETWTNVYFVQNSVNSVELKKDANGIPLSIRSNYSFGLRGDSKESVVEIKLQDGIPYCIYFPASTTECTRSPNKNIIAKMVDGKYAKTYFEKKQNEAQSKVDTGKVHVIVDKMPEFPNGPRAFSEYIKANLKYPAKERAMGIEGRVFVGFIVEPDGSVSDVNILRGLGGNIDQEAKRLIQDGPKWNPGTLSGVAVKVKMQMPILFRIQ